MGWQRRFHRKLSVVFLLDVSNRPWKNSPPDSILSFALRKTLPDTRHRMQRMHLIWKEEAGMRRLLRVQRAPVQPVPRCRGQLPKLSRASSIYATWWPVVAFYWKKKKVPLHVSLCKLSLSALLYSKHRASGSLVRCRRLLCFLFNCCN